MTDISASLGVYSPLGQVVAGSARGISESPTGVVTAVSATTLSVNVRGVNINAAYLDSYVSPQIGDLVALARWDATMLVLGRLAGVGANSVQNPSFEMDGTITSVPSLWNFATLAGMPAVSVQATGFAVDGLYECGVSAGGAAQDSYVYSAPIPVAAGQQWALSAFVAGVYPVGVTPSATGSVYALWFANDTDLYPTTSAPDTAAGSVSPVSEAPLHASVSGTVTVPGSTAFMRVALRSVSAASITLFWDLVTARRIG